MEVDLIFNSISLKNGFVSSILLSHITPCSLFPSLQQKSVSSCTWLTYHSQKISMERFQTCHSMRGCHRQPIRTLKREISQVKTP
ncbi:hypothetical protein V6Z12_A11G380500 [Gossypium hirsutum]